MLLALLNFVVGLVNVMLFLLDGKGCCMVGANTMYASPDCRDDIAVSAGSVKTELVLGIEWFSGRTA